LALLTPEPSLDIFFCRIVLTLGPMESLIFASVLKNSDFRPSVGYIKKKMARRGIFETSVKRDKA
jgi:hypothetical protein